MISIKNVGFGVEREPLLKPFGFKGSSLTELWQVAACLQNNNGAKGVGVGVQSVLWSDAGVFLAKGEYEANRAMLAVTEYALGQLTGKSFPSPMELQNGIISDTCEYAAKVTGRSNLRLTFIMNSLVAVDNAAWLLYAREKGVDCFEALIPEAYRNVLSGRQEKLACIPLVTYGTGEKEIVKLAEAGIPVFKIKIGSDPDGDGCQEKMLKWDMQRLEQIHSILKEYKTGFTENGFIAYYLDANGRYGSKDTLLKFLEHAGKIGALERTILLEEPFPEEFDIDVHDIPVRIAADESVHSEAEAKKRISLGYGAMTLKPIAKTLSLSLKIANVARQNGIPCFCADLTVNPLLVDWNKNVAARLAPLPGMKIGVVEMNGDLNYLNWEFMKGYHPFKGMPWSDPEGGIFNLGSSFYEHSGGIFGRSPHYEGILKYGKLYPGGIRNDY